MTETYTIPDTRKEPHNGRSAGAPRANSNAFRHGLRAGKLPKNCRYIENSRNELRRQIESEIVACRGIVAVYEAALAQSLCRHETLSCLVRDGEIDREQAAQLLRCMQQESREIKPEKLGVIGEEHFRIRFEAIGAEPESFQYKRKTGIENGQPYVVEVAFAHAPELKDREIISGVNWSPSIDDIPFQDIGNNWYLGRMALSSCGVRADRSMTGRRDFVRSVPPWMVSTCFAVLGNKMLPSLVDLSDRDQGGFLDGHFSR